MCSDIIKMKNICSKIFFYEYFCIIPLQWNTPVPSIVGLTSFYSISGYCHLRFSILDLENKFGHTIVFRGERPYIANI